MQIKTCRFAYNNMQGCFTLPSIVISLDTAHTIHNMRHTAVINLPVYFPAMY